MGTTEAPIHRSIQEIHELLVQAGATEVSSVYSQGHISGMTWAMTIEGKSLRFKMPARVEALKQQLLSQYRRGPRGDTDISVKAERIAWRQLFRWVQAQVAFVETGMAQRHEVFMPYVQSPNGQTMFELFHETQFKRIEAPGKKS